MSEIPLNAKVQCSDGPCGEVTDVIVNPISLTVTHIVLKYKELPYNNPTRLVPADMIANVTEERITLSCSVADVGEMKPFLVDHFVQESPTGKAYEGAGSWSKAFTRGAGSAYAKGGAYASQYVVNDTGYDSVRDANIPKGERSIHAGMEIKATDGKVGTLDELVLDGASGAITHIQMREGHLWGKKDIAIAVTDIDFVNAKTVYLKIDKAAVKALPAVKVKR